MLKEDTVDTQKEAYDAVEGNKKILERDIKELISRFGKLLGKDRITRVAGILSNQLITVVGVETYNDLRNVTFEIYVDRCGVTMIDAALLIKQFGIPVAPPAEVTGMAEEALKLKPYKPVEQPSQGASQGEEKGADDTGDAESLLKVNDDFWNAWETRQKEKRQVRSPSQGAVSDASQSLGQGVKLAQGDGSSGVFTSMGAKSDSTHMTVGTTPSQAQSLQESLAQSMVQMSQAIVASAAQTQAMLAQGVGRLPVLKLDGRARPKVKDVKKWIKDIGDKRYTVKGFMPALDMLRKCPEKIKRDDFAEIYISPEDDMSMYHQVKSSMSEVYDLMSVQMRQVERKSTMGLIYDVLMFAIQKDHQIIASKVNWMINEMPMMMEHEDVIKVFDKWEDTMTEVQHSGMITDEMIVQSMHTMMQRFQPQIHGAQGMSDFYHKRNLDKYVSAMRMQVEAMAPRLEAMHKKKDPSKGKGKGKGKGKPAGKGSGKGRSYSGDTTESDSDSVSKAKGKVAPGKGRYGICYDFKSTGQCWYGDQCKYRHDGSGMVMLMDRLDELSEKFESMSSAAGSGLARVSSEHPAVTLPHPKGTLKTHTVLTTIKHNVSP